MEKVVVLLRSADADDAWCEHLRGAVAEEVLGLGVAGLAVNVRDAPVRESLMTLTTLEPPVVAVASLWVEQHYGDAARGAIDLLASTADAEAAYLVTESAPLPPPAVLGGRTPGLANVALLRRPADLDAATWRHRWHVDHTPVAIATQATSGYVQNEVVRALTPDAPAVDAIVEELFPDAATHDLHAFFGAVDDADLSDRMGRLLASTAAFGASQDVDTVPTSRYLLRSPFGAQD